MSTKQFTNQLRELGFKPDGESNNGHEGSFFSRRSSNGGDDLSLAITPSEEPDRYSWTIYNYSNHQERISTSYSMRVEDAVSQIRESLQDTNN